MPAIIQEWLNLLVRWIHVIAAIMWIGDSFLFMWLDSHLSKPRADRDENVTGELWMTHSGGFYEVMKRKSLRKGEAVGTLYWFKWESYTTWLSGFLLLFIVYWLGGAALLVEPGGPLSPVAGVHVSLLLLPAGYALYEGLWATPLAKNQKAFGFVGLLLIVGAAYGLTQVFAPRAAFLQVGAMLGTIMTANVFFRIIPAQKHMLAATEAGTPVDTSYGLRAKGRSIQNHYLTLPVLFCMLSNHFPSMYGNARPWAVLGLLVIVGAALKYVMNFRGQTHPIVFVGGAMALIAVVLLTTVGGGNAMAGLAAYEGKAPVSFATVQTIMQARCVTCHAKQPTSPMFPAAPNGIVLETPEQIAQQGERIFVRAVTTKTMPLGNMTGMTDEERSLVGAWVAQGRDVHAAGASVVEVVDAGAPEEPAQVDKSPAGLARHRFKNVCAVCHGANGDGQTPTAAAFQVKPRNFTDPEWQKATSDDSIRTIILKGGAAVGKSATMPPNQDLEAKPEVVEELVKIIRGFGASK